MKKDSDMNDLINDDQEKEGETMTATRQINGPSPEQRDHDKSSGTLPPPMEQDEMTDPDKCFQVMNQRHALVNAGNKVSIVDERSHDAPIMAKSVFMDLYANTSVMVGKRQKTWAEHWFYHKHRRQFPGGYTFDPSGKASSRKYNLWQGFAVQPSPSHSCKRFLDHLEGIICNGDEECYEYLLNWLSLLVQKPQKLPGVAVCLLSKPGTGKGMTMNYIGQIFGPHYKHLTDKNQLLGRFTGQLMDAVLVFADEIHWDGNKSESGLIKGMITEKTRMMERKHHDPLEIMNCVHLILASNEKWAIPADIGDRRFFVLDVSPNRVGDTVYFETIYDEMRNGGPAALLSFLMKRDITLFNPGDFPKTDARVQQQIESLDSVDKWILQQLDSGAVSRFCHSEDRSWPSRVIKKAFYDDYCESFRANQNRGNPTSLTAFTQSLGRLGVTPTKAKDDTGQRVPAYRLPDLVTMRKAFDDLLGHSVGWDTT